MTAITTEHYIDLHHAEIDWVTLTSFDVETWRHWARKCEQSKPLHVRDQAIRNYMGAMSWFSGGSCFVGQGEQQGASHYLIDISGSLAQEWRNDAFNQRREYDVSCRRVDLQVTVPEPEGWSQIAFLNRMERKNRITGWATSRDAKAGALQTVYVGSWHSDRLTTVYVKLTAGNERLLRFEVRYKRDRANAMLRQLAQGELPDNFLAYELQTTLSDNKLRSVFEPSLTVGAPVAARVRLKDRSDKTGDWLVDKVLPTLIRIISEHDTDGRVLTAYADAIKKVTSRGN